MNHPTVPNGSKFDARLPLAQAHTLPAAAYRDASVYEAECRAVFHNSWQCVGRSASVQKPGDYLTADVAGEPIVVVRDQSGTLRAFFNVCRHRAARVVTEAEGHATKLRCVYHGWTYDLAGHLRGTPDFDGVADFSKECNGLVPLSVGEWGPLVFVHIEQPVESLTEFLASVSERTAGLGMERLHFFERRTYDLACNWKVYVDNYLDGGYHINTIHPALAGVLDYSQYRTELFAQSSVQSSPTVGAEGDVRSGTAYYWWLYPNLMLNIYAGVMDTNLVLPLGPDRCRVVFDFYFADVASERAQGFMRESIKVADQVQAEDIHICEDVQRGLASRSYSTGRFSVKREAAGYHFHQLIARKLEPTTTL